MKGLLLHYSDKFLAEHNYIRHIALAFANYCLEYEITEPTYGDYAKFKEQGFDYYDKHIENANNL